MLTLTEAQKDRKTEIMTANMPSLHHGAPPWSEFFLLRNDALFYKTILLLDYIY